MDYLEKQKESIYDLFYYIFSFCRFKPSCSLCKQIKKILIRYDRDLFFHIFASVFFIQFLCVGTIGISIEYSKWCHNNIQIIYNIKALSKVKQTMHPENVKTGELDIKGEVYMEENKHLSFGKKKYLKGAEVSEWFQLRHVPPRLPILNGKDLIVQQKNCFTFADQAQEHLPYIS